MYSCRGCRDAENLSSCKKNVEFHKTSKSVTIHSIEVGIHVVHTFFLYTYVFLSLKFGFNSASKLALGKDCIEGTKLMLVLFCMFL